MAILAPNGNGKSSLVDAFEYYFASGKPGIARLGMKSSGKYAGPRFITHVSANKNDKKISIKFTQNNSPLEGTRTDYSMPDVVKQILPLIKVPFIIRDYELREFVQENQYNKLVDWFNLKPLDMIQENLRTLKKRINGLKDKYDGDVLLTQLKMFTHHEFQTGDESEVLKWLNENVLAKLNEPIKFEKMSDDDPAFQKLVRRSEMEQISITAGHLNNLLSVIRNLLVPNTAPQAEPTGLIVAFEKAVSCFKNATANVNDAKSKINDHVFKEVWNKSKELLLCKPDLDNCPVCKTPFTSGSLGSRDAVLKNLLVNLDHLNEYKVAEENLNVAETTLGTAAAHLKTKLDEFFRWAGPGYQYKTIVDYNKTLQYWKTGDNAPDSTDAASTLVKIHSEVTNDIKMQTGERAYSDAFDTTKRLLEIVTGWNRLSRIRSNLTLISDELDKQAKIIDRTIANHIADLVNKLKDEAQAINQEIQGPDAPNHPIKIKLPEKSKRIQRAAHVVTNFMNRGEDVPPDGVLSESQTRTLALAIRLAAIVMFNQKFKILVLDDIAMSYDAERRQHIAALLQKRFSEFQVIVATHDAGFYDELTKHLHPKKWRFVKFNRFVENFGPVIENEKTWVEIINERIANNKPVNGNDMRKAYEEWFKNICVGFETLLPTRQRPNELHDYIESLARFFKKNKQLKLPRVSGYGNNYLEVIKNTKIFNISSHHNPHLAVTPNELKAEWRGFLEFINQFKCSDCGGDRFKIDNKKPHCEDCGIEFTFTQGASTTNV